VSGSASDVIVIGAGMAGVTAARELAASGLSVLILEARRRVGGRILSVRDLCEQPVEAGAEFVHGDRAATWTEIKRLGLETRNSPMILRSAFNLGGATRWLPWLLLHPETWSCAGMRRGIARAQPPDRSARHYIEERGYRGRARLLTEMTFLQHLPAGGDEVGVLGFVDDGVLDLQGRTNYRVLEGYDSLPRAMADGLDVRLGAVVETVCWDDASVRVRLGDGAEHEARAGISTLPVGVLQSGSVRFAPALPPAKQQALSHLYMGPIVKLLLRFDERFWPRWMEKVECATGPVNLYWCVFRGVRGAPAVLTAYAIGPRGAALAQASEEAATDIVVEDLARLFPGTDPRRALMSCRHIDWVHDPFSRGGYTVVGVGGRGAREALRAADTGALFWAGSSTESRPVSETVETAYLSGLRAAAEVRSRLENRARRMGLPKAV